MARKAKETKPSATAVKEKAPAKAKTPKTEKAVKSTKAKAATITPAADMRKVSDAAKATLDAAGNGKTRKAQFKNVISSLKEDVKAFISSVKALKGAHGTKHIKTGERLVAEFDSFGLANDATVQKLRSFITGLASSK